MINAHIKDAAALCCYFAWLEKEIAKGHHVTEVSGAKKLDSLRRFKMVSFLFQILFLKLGLILIVYFLFLLIYD